MSTASYLQRLFSVDGRVAIVTGGSSGIGRAIAMALAGAGARVVLVAQTPETLGRVADEIDADGGTAAFVAGDLGSRDRVREIADEAAAVYGEPDIVVSSAGVNLRPPMDEITADIWDRTMAVNLEAPFLLGQRFGPGMAARGHGRLIHLSSQQARRAFVNSGAYGVSKGGLESLARSQAEAWSGHGVTSNVLVPGVVLTPMNAHVAADPALVAALAERTLVGRNGLPEDFAGAALLLASDAGAYITGQAIVVDGGLSAH